MVVLSESYKISAERKKKRALTTAKIQTKNIVSKIQKTTNIYVCTYKHKRSRIFLDSNCIHTYTQ